MKKLIALLFISNFAFSQIRPTTDFNTIFICIDSSTYESIFKDNYIKDSLFITREQSTQTNSDNYNGKYAIGEAATIEFFKPKPTGQFGDNLGDFGIEFKTRKIGELNKIVEEAGKNNFKIDTQITNLNETDTIIPWYKTVQLLHSKSNIELSFLEYQTEYLNYIGFEGDELTKEITFSEFNKILSNGKKYPRLFKKISSITIKIDKNTYENIEQFCRLNNMQKEGDFFFNSDLKIFTEVSRIACKSEIKKIELELLYTQPNKIIFVSEKLKYNLKSNKCEIIFE
jgi:hypothetical protein